MKKILHDCPDCQGHDYWWTFFIEEIGIAFVKIVIFFVVAYLAAAAVTQSAMKWMQEIPVQCQQAVVDSFHSTHYGKSE